MATVARLSIRARLLLLLVVVPTLASIPLGYVTQQRMERQSRAWVESRSLGVARLLAVALAPAAEFDDDDAALAALRHLEAVDGAVSAKLYRADRTLLASWGRPGTPGSQPTPGADAVRFGEELVLVAVEVASRIGPPASLVVGFGLSELAARQAEQRWLALSAGAFLLLLAALVALAGNLILARPLQRVTDVARRISAGEEQARVALEVHRRDEVGTLARAFDVMLRRLRQQRDELQAREEASRALNATLEDRVADRTAELGAANQELEQRLAELRTAHEQLVVSERRAGVGQLAAGVAHEINNPLAYVTGNLAFVAGQAGEAVEALRGGGRDGADAALRALADLGPALADARQGANRVHQIVRGLKAFSRGDEDVRTPVDVAASLSVAIDMAMNEIRHRARLVREVGPLPPVDASEVRLTQVFLNLLVNAAHAIPAGNAASQCIRVSAAAGPAGEVVVEVRDTGCGIPAEVRARLFEPFFTTKPTGVGTGLGLAISLGIVTSYGGRIEVESEPGRGSTFRVRLPASTRAASSAPPPPARGAAEPRLRVLVVDDESAVGDVVVRLLGRTHEVRLERSPGAALALIRGGERFDRVLCDLEMPEMGGAAFWEALRALDPTLADSILFMTGGAFTEAAVELTVRERARILDKPLDFELLRRKLHAP